MEDYLVELIFEDVLLEDIGFLINEFLFGEKSISNYYFTCDVGVVDLSDVKSVNKIFLENDGFGFFVNLKELKVENTWLINCGLAVYKDESRINLELNFQLSDLKKEMLAFLVENLMKFAKVISVKYRIDHYFCGFEPAQDPKMRLFTNEQLGPLKIE